jgi:hypothetical protein
MYTNISSNEIKQIHKFLALFEKSGGFENYWRLIEK